MDCSPAVELQQQELFIHFVSKDAEENDGEEKASPVNTEDPHPEETEEEMRHCKHCDYQAEDWPTFSQHVFQQCHIKKVAEAYNIHLSADAVSNNFTCEECNVVCNAWPSWNAHLLGSKHRKTLESISKAKAEEKIQEQTMKIMSGGPMKNKQFGNVHNRKPYDRVQKIAPPSNSTPALAAEHFASYPEPLIGLEFVTEIQVTGETPRYECTLCDTKFDHNLKFPHLVGQKHRINVLKIKRPEALKGMTGLKRAEVTVILAREAVQLEQAEGRQQVKTQVRHTPGLGATRGGRGNPSSRGAASSRAGYQGTRGASRGTVFNPRGRGQRGRGNSGYTTRGGGISNPRGLATEQLAGSYPGSNTNNHPSSYDMSFNNSFRNDYSANTFESQNYGGHYMRNANSGQSYSDQAYPGQSYPEQKYSGPTNPGQAYPHNDFPASRLPQIQHPFNRETPSTERPKTSDSKDDISVGLASALGDLTKLVQNEDDASVALHVSNALTQALLKYRMTSETEGLDRK